MYASASGAGHFLTRIRTHTQCPNCHDKLDPGGFNGSMGAGGGGMGSISGLGSYGNGGGFAHNFQFGGGGAHVPGRQSFAGFDDGSGALGMGGRGGASFNNGIGLQGGRGSGPMDGGGLEYMGPGAAGGREMHPQMNASQMASHYHHQQQQQQQQQQQHHHHHHHQQQQYQTDFMEQPASSGMMPTLPTYQDAGVGAMSDPSYRSDMVGAGNAIEDGFVGGDGMPMDLLSGLNT